MEFLEIAYQSLAIIVLLLTVKDKISAPKITLKKILNADYPG